MLRDIGKTWVPTFAGATALLLAGCATTAGRPVAIESEAITYETGPCFGTCPVYAVTVRPDGSGVFEGKRFTAVTGTREFTSSPQAYRAFAAALAPYRPVGERLVEPGAAECPMLTTDMPRFDVRWSEPSGAAHHLGFYYGCREGNEAMAAAIKGAPDLLPIAAFVGKR